MQNQLRVENNVQKALFLGEMQGQFSDGLWENAHPRDHWIIWSGLEFNQVVVTNDPADVGRNFPAIKDNYALGSKMLMEAIGERMLMLARLVRVAPEATMAIIEKDHWLLYEDYREYETAYFNVVEGTARQYDIDRVADLLSRGITLDVYRKAAADAYDMKAMLKDLRGLSRAMQTARVDLVMVS